MYNKLQIGGCVIYSVALQQQFIANQHPGIVAEYPFLGFLRNLFTVPEDMCLACLISTARKLQFMCESYNTRC